MPQFVAWRNALGFGVFSIERPIVFCLREARRRAYRRFSAAVAGAAAISCGALAYGEPVDWLYDVDVPAKSQSEGDRRSAARAALREMLMRMTGLATVPMSDPVARALNAPERYYVQYRFTQAGDDEEQRVRVSFEPEAVQKLVADAALPIWSADRPTVLAWLAVRENGRIRILDSASDHPLAQGLRERSRQRGVPLRLPLLDLEDRDLISPPAVWDGFAFSLHAASRRYDADVVLIGRASLDADGNWRTRWEFWLNGAPWEFSFSDATVEAGAIRAMDEVANELMQRSAVFGRDATTIEIAVRGAGSIQGYAALMRHLSNLEYIERVQLKAAEQETLTLSLVTRSNPERLSELLSMDGAFRRLAAMPNLRGDTSPNGEPITLLWHGKR